MTLTYVTVRLVWASWDSRTHSINNVCLTPVKKRLSLLTAPWKPSVTTRLKPLPTYLKNAVVTLLLKVHCGVKVFYPSTHWTTLQKVAATIWMLIAAIPSTGIHYVTACNALACVIPTPWRLHRLQLFQTSVASVNLSNRLIRIYLLNRIYRANSP